MENEYTFLGKVSGTITTEVKIPNNLKIDAVFISNGQQKTYAEMTIEEKKHHFSSKKVIRTIKSI